MNLGDKSYGREVDRVDKERWHDIVQLFEDGIIHQTWSYGAFRWGERRLSHLVLRRNGVLVAAAQVTIVRLPILGCGVAHVKFGPMWRPRGAVRDLEIYRQMLHALREEYAERRGLLLRLKPWEADDDAGPVQAIRGSEGLKSSPHVDLYRTFVLDLSHGMDELREGLARKWRRDLARAQARDLSVMEETGPAAIETFIQVYSEMYDRKAYTDFTDIDLLPGYYADLPHALRPHVMICRHQGDPVAAIVYSVIGRTALALYGATTRKGLPLGASYLVNWSVIEQLKERGTCRWYDLVGGLSHPGIRHFKAGIVRRCGKEVHMSDFDVCHNLASLVAVRSGDRLRAADRSARNHLSRWRSVAASW